MAAKQWRSAQHLGENHGGGLNGGGGNSVGAKHLKWRRKAVAVKGEQQQRKQ